MLAEARSYRDDMFMLMVEVQSVDARKAEMDFRLKVVMTNGKLE